MSIRTLEPETRRWSREEYYGLAGHGWFEGQNVELISGEIIQMPPMGHPHVVAVTRAAEALRRIFGDRNWVRVQSPLSVDPGNEPEPDVAVAQLPMSGYQDHPATALLIVEVSDTSLRHDRRKAGLYASAGVDEYWIVDLKGRVVEVYRQPVADAAQADFGHRYRECQKFVAGQSIAPLAAPEHQVGVAELLGVV
jgi:Uma2 family endonuclease